MRRGSIQLTPMSQPDSPMRTNATLKRADSLHTRTSDASASAKPPPAHGPLTAAITGWRSVRIRGTSPAMCCCTARPTAGPPHPF